ncbi:MAG: hypothetical protein ACRD2T_02475 [Thermoanaerobaculia bacterium]
MDGREVRRGKDRPLRPCADCGGEGTIQTIGHDGTALSTVVCDACGARTPLLPLAEARKAWDRGNTDRRRPRQPPVGKP